MLLVIVIILFLVGAFLFYASYSISAGVYVKSVCKLDDKRTIAFTFDDGVDPVMTPKILDILEKNNAKATFFIIGKKAQQYPELVKQIAAQGHSIGSHSMYHKNTFPMQKSQCIYDEIMLSTSVIEDVIRAKVKFFRPPFGVTNPLIAKALKRTELVSIGWNIRSLDTIGNEVEKVTERVCRKVKGGDIILLHDDRENADLLLENILEKLKPQGFNYKSIDAALKH